MTSVIVGSVTDSSAYTSDDFDAETDGETVTVTVPMKVMLQIRSHNGNLIDAEATDKATLTVTNEEVNVSAEVGGNGSLELQVNQSDPTPS